MFLWTCLRTILSFNVLNETVEDNVHLPLDKSPELCRNKENRMADVIYIQLVLQMRKIGKLIQSISYFS